MVEEDRKSSSVKFPTNQGHMIEEDSLIQRSHWGSQAGRNFIWYMDNKLALMLRNAMKDDG